LVCITQSLAEHNNKRTHLTRNVCLQRIVNVDLCFD